MQHTVHVNVDMVKGCVRKGHKGTGMVGLEPGVEAWNTHSMSLKLRKKVFKAQ